MVLLAVSLVLLPALGAQQLVPAGLTAQLASLQRENVLLKKLLVQSWQQHTEAAPPLLSSISPALAAPSPWTPSLTTSWVTSLHYSIYFTTATLPLTTQIPIWFKNSLITSTITEVGVTQVTKTDTSTSSYLVTVTPSLVQFIEPIPSVTQIVSTTLTRQEVTRTGEISTSSSRPGPDVEKASTTARDSTEAEENMWADIMGSQQ